MDREGRRMEEEVREAAHRQGLGFAEGSPLRPVLELARVAARREVNVYLHGESGTGKEGFASFIHAESRREKGPFIVVNCSALSPTLLESELFGHRKGAFTGATEDHPGLIGRADGGTLFLDEIGDMPLSAQSRLLRVLQERKVMAVGGREERRVDFVLICATHRDLKKEAEEGRFREDLLYRVDGIRLRIPALRERKGDIPFLFRRFLREEGKGEEKEMDRLMREIPDRFWDRPFPGNVRELKNLASRFLTFRQWAGPEQAVAMLMEEGQIGSAEEGRPFSKVRNSRLSDGDILQALRQSAFHRENAARTLGITRRALQYRLARISNGNRASERLVLEERV